MTAIPNGSACRRSIPENAGNPAAPSSARPRTVSVAVAARLLDMSERQVRDLCASEAISAVRIGERGHWRVLRSWIDAYLGELERKSAESAELARTAARRGAW